MAKEDIAEGGKIMDPAGPEFQTMLSQAKQRSEEKVAVPETKESVVEKDVEKSVSSTETAETLPPESEDPTELKAQIVGIKAELARVRKQKSGGEGESAALRETLAEMQGQLKVLREGRTGKSVEEQIQELSDDQFIDNKVAWDDELADARVEARLAERDRDEAGVAKHNARIETARKMQKLYEKDNRQRTERTVSTTRSQGDTKAAVTAELDHLFSSVYEVVPDISNKESAIWKAGQEEYASHPHLMKQLGPLGELIATATAIAKNPTLLGKKATSDVLKKIEGAMDKSFQKGGSAPKINFTKQTAINSQKDLTDFESQVAAIKMG